MKYCATLVEWPSLKFSHDRFRNASSLVGFVRTSTDESRAGLSKFFVSVVATRNGCNLFLEFVSQISKSHANDVNEKGLNVKNNRSCQPVMAFRDQDGKTESSKLPPIRKIVRKTGILLSNTTIQHIIVSHHEGLLSTLDHDGCAGSWKPPSCFFGKKSECSIGAERICSSHGSSPRTEEKRRNLSTETWTTGSASKFIPRIQSFAGFWPIPRRKRR